MTAMPHSDDLAVLSKDRQAVEPGRQHSNPVRKYKPDAERNLHLPPHLREVCALLAAGLVRLQRRTAEEFARDAAQAGDQAESSLHFTARQSGDADPKERPTA